jgi:hypothetical protein
MLIRNPGPPKNQPIVSVTGPASQSQIRICFNAALVRQASLQDVPRMAIDFDEERRRITFISTPRGDRDREGYTFPLMRDGGHSSKNTASKVLYVRRQLLQFIRLGRYEPKIERGRAGPKITIDLRPDPVSYDAPKEIPSRARGVYRILDANGNDIDIGCSKTDVRGRVLTKWGHEKEATSVVVYALKTESECLHWERLFQKHFEAISGRLPRYCEVRGQGCGCAECR